MASEVVVGLFTLGGVFIAWVLPTITDFLSHRRDKKRRYSRALSVLLSLSSQLLAVRSTAAWVILKAPNRDPRLLEKVRRSRVGDFAETVKDYYEGLSEGLVAIAEIDPITASRLEDLMQMCYEGLKRSFVADDEDHYRHLGEDFLDDLDGLHDEVRAAALKLAKPAGISEARVRDALGQRADREELAESLAGEFDRLYVGPTLTDSLE